MFSQMEQNYIVTFFFLTSFLPWFLSSFLLFFFLVFILPFPFPIKGPISLLFVQESLSVAFLFIHYFWGHAVTRCCARHLGVSSSFLYCHSTMWCVEFYHTSVSACFLKSGADAVSWELLFPLTKGQIEIVLGSVSVHQFWIFFWELLAENKFPIRTTIFSFTRTLVSKRGVPFVEADVLNVVQNQLATMFNQPLVLERCRSLLCVPISIWLL